MLSEVLIALIFVSLCMLLHLFGLLFLANRLLRHREYFEETASMSQLGFVLILLFSLILVLHLAETCLWALLYYMRGLFPEFETSLYFSLGTYTTIGYGDVVLPKSWRLLGAIEVISGVLLCGVSTAFLFTILNAMFQIRVRTRY